MIAFGLPLVEFFGGSSSRILSKHVAHRPKPYRLASEPRSTKLAVNNSTMYGDLQSQKAPTRMPTLGLLVRCHVLSGI